MIWILDPRAVQNRIFALSVLGVLPAVMGMILFLHGRIFFRIRFVLKGLSEAGWVKQMYQLLALVLPFGMLLVALAILRKAETKKHLK